MYFLAYSRGNIRLNLFLFELSYLSTFHWSAAQMSKHQDGKKHLRLVASAAARVKHEKHSVFVRNFPPSTTEDELKMYFGQFGVVEKVVLDKSTVCIVC